MSRLFLCLMRQGGVFSYVRSECGGLCRDSAALGLLSLELVENAADELALDLFDVMRSVYALFRGNEKVHRHSHALALK